MTEQDSTKEKILTVAQELFAKNGFDGTSVRDIANQAGVNVAAVNYHFESKQKLFWMIFQHSMEGLETKVRELYEGGAQTTEDLAAGIFQMMHEDWAGLRNTYRMFLSPEMPESNDDEYTEFCSGNTGPPGTETVMKAMQKDLESPAPLSALNWGVRVIFSHMAHQALIINTDYFKRFASSENMPFKDPKVVEMTVRILVRSIIHYITEHGDKIAENLPEFNQEISVYGRTENS